MARLNFVETREIVKRGVGNKGKPGLSKKEREREGGREKKKKEEKKSSEEGINLALGK